MPETLFQLSNLYIMPFWLLMIFLPHWDWTKRIIGSLWFLLPLALAYSLLIVPMLLGGNLMAFRSQNPLLGKNYDKRLRNIKSIYDISITDTAGNTINLGKFKGKYILLDFWASWCSPCIYNIPFQERLISEYAAAPIKFIAVSLDTRNNEWKEAIKKYNFSCLQLSDGKGFAGLAAVYCKVAAGIPQYVLIDKAGNIINANLPQPSNPELKILLDKLLNEN